jgi:hypothetical protein
VHLSKVHAKDYFDMENEQIVIVISELIASGELTNKILLENLIITQLVN